MYEYGLYNRLFLSKRKKKSVPDIWEVSFCQDKIMAQWLVCVK